MIMKHASVMIMNHCESSRIMHHHASWIKIHHGSSCIMHDHSSPATMGSPLMAWGVSGSKDKQETPKWLQKVRQVGKSGGAIRTEIWHGNGRHESSESLDHIIVHRFSARIQPRRRHFANPLALQSRFLQNHVNNSSSGVN